MFLLDVESKVPLRIISEKNIFFKNRGYQNTQLFVGKPNPLREPTELGITKSIKVYELYSATHASDARNIPPVDVTIQIRCGLSVSNDESLQRSSQFRLVKEASASALHGPDLQDFTSVDQHLLVATTASTHHQPEPCGVFDVSSDEHFAQFPRRRLGVKLQAMHQDARETGDDVHSPQRHDGDGRWT